MTHVVNTHVHFDHTFGNAAFEGATIHAHDNVGRTIEADTARIKAVFRADPGDGPELGYTAADVEEVLATTVRGPDRTFGSSASIDLGDRCVTMTYAGRGHTDGDIAVLVPDTSALFLGDLVEESAHPSFGGDCWPLDWADTLTSHLVWADEATVVVPGHGRPVDAGFVERQRDDIAAVGAVIRERRTAGLTVEQALAEPDPRLRLPGGLAGVGVPARLGAVPAPRLSRSRPPVPISGDPPALGAGGSPVSRPGPARSGQPRHVAARAARDGVAPATPVPAAAGPPRERACTAPGPVPSRGAP